MTQEELTNYGNDLILGDLVPDSDAGAMQAVASAAGGFLPRLQLFGSSSTAVKEDKIGQGRWGIVRAKDAVEDLGKTVDVVVVAGKAQAMRIKDGKVLTYYDHTLPEFKEIQDESADMSSGCMYGPIFLLWVPSANTFATYFMQSKTARRASGPLFGLVKKAATLGAELIKGGKHSWHGPTVAPCSTPLELPAIEEIKEQAERFLNAKSSTTVKVAEDDGVVR